MVCNPNVFTIVKLVVVSVHVPGLSLIDRCLHQAGFRQLLTVDNLRLYADKLDADDILLTKTQGIGYELRSARYALLDLTYEFEGLIGYFDLEDNYELEHIAEYLASTVVTRRKIASGKLQMPTI